MATLQKGQSSILEEMKSSCESLESTNTAVHNLSAKVNAIEQRIPSFQQLSDDVGLLRSSATTFETNIAGLSSRLEDLESRSRRSNLIFYGFEDNESESWDISKETILDACAEYIHITMASSEIERAHRLGRFLPAKKRPIIVKFANYKAKERILSHSAGFKNSNYSVSQDYSGPVRLARKKLVEHGRSLNTTFKLRFDKLLVGNKCFIYNPGTESVVEVQKN